MQNKGQELKEVLSGARLTSFNLFNAFYAFSELTI